MGGGSRMFKGALATERGEDQKKYWDRRNESDDASTLVGKGLGARADFKGFDQDTFAREKRESARRKRADRREERRSQREERQEFYREQMEERRRNNEMRRSKREMGEVGTLGGQNPYGDSAIWNNEKRSWEPNTKANNLAQWDAAKARSEADQGGTNLMGQSMGTNFGPGSSSRGTINEAPQTDNRDFKKLYEELLKIHNAGKK